MPEVSARKEHKLSNGVYARQQLAKFAASLKRWRTSKELTREQVAARVGCSSQQITNIENKYNFPSFAVYASICREMGVEPVADFPVA